jgi:hypothetical protein
MLVLVLVLVHWPMWLMHCRIIVVHISNGAEACFGLGACTGREVSEGEGDPEYVDDGSERVESIGSHVSGSSSGCGCNSEKGTWADGPWFNSS